MLNPSQSIIDQVASAVLYEGHVLYPYRPSLKNRQRWTFGGVLPRAYCEAEGSNEAAMVTQCLVDANPHATLEVTVRFLHLIERSVGKLTRPLEHWPNDGASEFTTVPSLQVGNEHYCAWQEAVERSIASKELRLDALAQHSDQRPFHFPASHTVEPLRDSADERFVGMLIREQQPITGRIECRAEQLGPTLYRLTVAITNDTPMEDADQRIRDEALLSAFVSTHTILSVRDGEFVSLIDPPDEHCAAVAACCNQGTWPVLIGEEGQRDTMLSAPIILYDYPQVAPESPGDLFDGTEIDEILTLRILTLTDDEKQQMASVEQQTRALLQRTEALGPDALWGMHGTFRNPGSKADDSSPQALLKHNNDRNK